MRKYILSAAVLLAFMASSEVQAQGFLGKLKDKVKEKVTERIDQKIDQVINGAVNGVDEAATEAVTGKKKNGKAAKAEAADNYENNVESAKSDFVRGSVVVFQDDMKGEQVGEFPSKWDLERGNAEIAKINGEYCIAMDQADSWIKPLIKGQPKNYLGEVFTIEYDMLYDDRPKDGASSVEIDIMAPEFIRDDEIYTFEYNFAYDTQDITCSYANLSAADNRDKQGRSTANAGTINDGKWHHFAVSFNKRALKFYVDGKRVINVPNAKAGAGWVTFFSSQAPRPTYLKNVIIAHGAQELYDRNATDASADAIAKAIQQTGKFVTNNILFETGKADLKSESMIEIMKVADYMKKNPSARFEVVGHTDNQGSDKINDPLSQKRAEAIVKALEGLGVDGFNLKATGKGSHEPVADNKTEAGRAQNRRVEFIKK